MKLQFSDEMVTHSGIVYNAFTGMEPDQVSIEDIAHSLSMQVRFNGHLKYPYSVAAHSVVLSYLVDPTFIKQQEGESQDPITLKKHGLTNILWALLHDAGEAYISDIPAPVKQHAPQIVAFEREIMVTVAEKFKLPVKKPTIVGKLDKLIAYAEADFMSPNKEFWQKLWPELYKNQYKSKWEAAKINQLMFKLADRSYAKQEFLSRFYEINNRLSNL